MRIYLVLIFSTALSSMLAPIALILIVSACWWLVAPWLRSRRFWARRGVPHDTPHWLFGSLTFLLKENPSRWMIKAAQKCKTPYVGIWLFWKPALLVQSPELAKRILIKDADNFRDRYATSGSSDPIGKLNLFTVKDPTWSTIRRRLTVVFTASRLRSLHTLASSKGQQLVQRINNENEKGNAFDSQTIFTDYTSDIIGTAAFGVECNATIEGDGAMRKITKDFQVYSLFRAMAWGSIFFFPQLVDIFRFSFFPKDTTEYFRKIWRTIVAQRGGYEEPVADTRDLVDALIKIKQEAALENEVISEDLLIAQASVFVQGGFETSASTMSFVVLELAYQPEIQDKLYQELCEAKQKAGDKELDMNTLSELTYLNCVIKETLRKYNAMGWFDRVANQDYKIDENLTIPAGTPVYVNGIGIHYNEDYWPEPEKFDPDRFLPENEKDIQPFTYIPFGEGPRMCIGKRFAMVTLWYGISNLFLNFKIRPLSMTKKPEDLFWSNKTLLLVPGEPISVGFVPRHP